MSNYRASEIGERPLVNSSLISQNTSHLVKKQARDLQDYRQINIYDEATEAQAHGQLAQIQEGLRSIKHEEVSVTAPTLPGQAAQAVRKQTLQYSSKDSLPSKDQGLGNTATEYRSMVDEITSGRYVRSNTYAGHSLDEGENVGSNQDPSEDVRSHRRMIDDLNVKGAPTKASQQTRERAAVAQKHQASLHQTSTNSLASKTSPGSKISSNKKPNMSTYVP